MITITPSYADTVNVGELTGDATVRVDGIASYPGVAAGQWFWLFMTYETNYKIEKWVIIDPIRLTDALIKNGVEGLMSKSSLLRLPNDSRLVLTSYLRGEKMDDTNIQLVNSGGGDGGDVVEDFEGYSSGPKPSPFDTKYMTFTGSGQSLVLNQDSRKMRHNTAINNSSLQITLNETYSNVVVDVYCKSNRSARMICEYEGGVQEIQIHDQYIKPYTFEHPGIQGFKIIGDGNGCVVQLDNFKLSK